MIMETRQFLAIFSSAVQAILIFVLFFSAVRQPVLTLTLRRQFDDWGPVLNLFRNVKDIQALQARYNGSEGLRQHALDLTWCGAIKPPNTERAPYCSCISRQYTSLVNATADNPSSVSAQAAEDAVMGIVSCSFERPTWRVRNAWTVRYGTPAVYVLFVSVCLVWASVGLSRRLTSIPVWGLCVLVCVLLVFDGFLLNAFWIFTIVLVGILIDWILLPGMRPSDVYVELGKHVPMDRVPSCFWWSEYLCAPVFALYVPLMHYGRDVVMTGVVVMLGTAVGGLGLRSFWCGQAYKDGFKAQYRKVMQYIVWLGVVACAFFLFFITAVYYNKDCPYNMGNGSVFLFAITVVIGLLQWPGNEDMLWVLPTQVAMAIVRNVVLASIVISDVRKQ